MRVTVIGGGIVGLATAYRLEQRYPDAKVTVLEKEVKVGQHQSGHNSGVLHCGLYYKPGSVKARLAVTGIRQMVAFCQENAIPHEICGKLVVAVDETEIQRLKDLHTRGQQNGLECLEWLTRDQMREIEPYAGGVAALRVPQEGIVDYGKVCEALRSRLQKVATKAEVALRIEEASGSPTHPRATTSPTSWSTAPVCTATGSANSRAKSEKPASCHFVANTTRSSRRASIWSAT